MRAARSYIAAMVAITATTLAVVLHFTHGLSGVTSDGVRRARVSDTPRPVPAIPLKMANGQLETLDSLVRTGQKATVITIVYLTCQDVCVTTAGVQGWLQERILARSLQGQVQLLTISFDAVHDTPRQLTRHAARLHAQEDVWRFASVRDGEALRMLLETFEVFILPDGRGGYAHNAALFVVNENGDLVGAFSVDTPDAVLRALVPENIGA